jgi:alpha-tubulin suppressor-like RCC1 family protein
MDEAVVKIPMEISFDCKISSIACGAGHSIALSATRRVFTWGNNVLGQLGLGDQLTRWHPFAVEGLKDVDKIASGAGHCVAIDLNGTVYTWGASADF